MDRNKEILINVTPHETRVALLDKGELKEFHLERTDDLGTLGNIYKGKVVRVLPGMQAAFVDIGLERAGFLHAADIASQKLTTSHIQGQSTTSMKAGIEQLAHCGQTMLVQISKDPIADKGARLDTQLSIASRNLVYLPNGNSIALSQKIENQSDRRRLKSLVRKLAETHSMNGGFIIRTLAESADEKDIALDIAFLGKRWANALATSKDAKPATLILQELSLELRTIRDLVDDDLSIIRVDSQQSMERLDRFAGEFIPSAAAKLELHTKPEPLFDLFSAEQQVIEALQNKVMLESGGDLRIDQTHAMTTIDVNTGAYVGLKDHRGTILKTNLEAVAKIAQQLRLRNTGGIIVIDFIDMVNTQDQQKVLAALELELSYDSVKTNVTEMSALGLVEVTRKRTHESLQQQMFESCDACKGSGMVKTVKTVCYEILREIMRLHSQLKVGEYTVIASAKVVEMLQDPDFSILAYLQETTERTIRLKVDPLLTQHQYDIALS